MDKAIKQSWLGIPPWIIIGAIIILAPVFAFWTIQNIHKQKENMILLLVEKGAALIRSFEAGTRTGMMGMMGTRGDFQLQRLLMETARQPDIAYLMVTDKRGKILAHNDPGRLGGTYGQDLDLERISRSDKVEWRRKETADSSETFEVYRQFLPGKPPFEGQHGRQRHFFRQDDHPPLEDVMPDEGRIIFVGLDPGPLEEARRLDMRQRIILALVLLLVSLSGIVTLFLAQAHRAARATLTRIKAFSDQVMESMPIGLLAMDMEGKIASCNQAAELMLHHSARELLGKKADDILPPELLTIVKGLEGPNKVVERELACSLDDGGLIPLSAIAALISGDDDSLLGYIILMRDLTEVKNLRQEIETGRRLASLGRIAAGIAHEIRNPLSSIKGFATYFRERYRDNPEDKTTAEIMVQEVDRLNRVVSDLLEFARPVQVQKKPTLLQTLIPHTLKMVEGQAREKNIRIRADLPPGTGEIALDPDRIREVLLNIYLNAIAAMGDGGTLSVALAGQDEPPGITIVVSDTGAGIEPKDLPHVFDPYFTTKPAGTGLGLAIVHKSIEAHQGEVKVESVPGRGTAITVFLPAA